MKDGGRRANVFVAALLRIGRVGVGAEKRLPVIPAQAGTHDHSHAQLETVPGATSRTEPSGSLISTCSVMTGRLRRRLRAISSPPRSLCYRAEPLPWSGGARKGVGGMNMLFAATVAAAFGLTSLSPALAQEYRFAGFDSPRGLTATANLRVPRPRPAGRHRL
jgi:hypothetical protein